MAKFICESCGERVDEAYYIGDKFLCGKCKPPSPLKKDGSPWAEPGPPKFKFREIDKLPALPENNLAYASDKEKDIQFSEITRLQVELGVVTQTVRELVERVCELEGERNERIYHGKRKE